MVDLQICRRARPSLDVACLLVTTTNEDFRANNLEEALKFYHSRLGHYLSKCGHDVNGLYPFEQLKKEFDECFVFGFCEKTMQMTFLLAPETNELSVDEMGGEEQQKAIEEFVKAQIMKAVESPEIREIVMNAIKEAAERKLI